LCDNWGYWALGTMTLESKAFKETLTAALYEHNRDSCRQNRGSNSSQ